MAQNKDLPPERREVFCFGADTLCKRGYASPRPTCTLRKAIGRRIGKGAL
jgi:hypothetical protein